MFFSMKIIIDAEAVMYEAYAMMKIEEERQKNLHKGLRRR